MYTERYTINSINEEKAEDEEDKNTGDSNRDSETKDTS